MITIIIYIAVALNYSKYFKMKENARKEFLLKVTIIQINGTLGTDK